MATLEAERFDGEFNSVNFTDPSELIKAITGVKPVLDQNFDLTTINPDRVQVRLDKNNAPIEMVKRFAEQMSFSVFPPIVVTKDHRITDGNTRYRARQKRGDRFAPALVIPISYDEADDDMKTRLEYLGLALNNSNGKPLDRAERRKMVREALELGMSVEQVVYTVGFPASTVAGIQKELAGETKLEQVGLKQHDEPAPVGDAVLRALGRAATLEDQSFTEVAKLTIDAGLGATEIKALAASVREAGSTTLAVERVAREREANAQRIADRAHGETGQPPASRLLRSRLSFIIGRQATALVEWNREMMGEHLELVEQAVVQLEKVASLQRQALEPED